MTISSETRKAGPYTGNSVTTSFTFAFKVFTAADVLVVRTDLNALETVLTLSTDYTVTLNSNQDSNPGGTVVLPAALTTGYLLTLSSQVGALQATDLTNQGGFYPSVLNTALDKLTILVQQLKEQVSRAIKVDISSGIDPATLITTLITSSANAVLAATQSFSNAAAALASQVAAAASATAAAGSATSASASAAAASAVVLSNEPVRPTIRPSLLLDFANTKQLDPRITFSRPTTATYYDEKTTAKAEENLLLYSEQFDNANWTKTNTTVTANSTVAPDGSTTADTLTADGTANTHGITQASVTSSVGKTFSIYAKAGTNNYLQLYFGGDANPWADFDLSLGTVGSTGTTVTASIVSVGSGWYRCIVTTTSTTATNLIAAIVSSSTAARGESNSLATTVILWGAQLEQRSTVTAYTPTTTAPITNYIPVLQTATSGQARFDHNPTTGESLGLLIEEQRTNLLTYSDDFSNAFWAKGNGTITANTIVAPDGTLTGDRLVSSASTAVTFVQQPFISTAQAYTATAYVKTAGAQFVQLLWSSAQSTNIANFDLVNGTIGTNTATNASITLVGNGWYRISITSTLAASSGAFNVYCIPTSTSSRGASYTGDGFSGIYIWGAQLEAGAFATSYIPTVASQVTRSADSASMTGTNFSSWYQQNQGSLYVSGSMPTTNTTSQFVAALTGANTNIVRLGNGVVDFFSNGSNTLTASTSFSQKFKSGLSYQSGQQFFYQNALPINTGSSTTTLLPVGLSQLVLQSGVGSYLNGWVSKITYYPQAVTSAQLQGLTTI